MLQIVERAVEDLIPYARNARTHSDAQVAQIAASIREFGWTNPVLIDEHNGLIAGHGRVLAARKLGTTTIPAIVLAGLSEPKKRALMLADNKLALNARWDDDLLRLEIDELHGVGFDLALTGFAIEELRDIVFPLERKDRSAERALDDGLVYQVIVECEGEDQQAEILGELRARGIKCKPLIL